MCVCLQRVCWLRRPLRCRKRLIQGEEKDECQDEWTENTPVLTEDAKMISKRLRREMLCEAVLPQNTRAQCNKSLSAGVSLRHASTLRNENPSQLATIRLLRLTLCPAESSNVDGSVLLISRSPDENVNPSQCQRSRSRERQCQSVGPPPWVRLGYLSVCWFG